MQQYPLTVFDLHHQFPDDPQFQAILSRFQQRADNLYIQGYLAIIHAAQFPGMPSRSTSTSGHPTSDNRASGYPASGHPASSHLASDHHASGHTA